MKILFATLSALVLTAGAALAADPILGLWKTIPDDNGYYGHIEVTECGDKICGELVASYVAADNSPYASENIGKMLIWDMINTGGGNYGKGRVYSPDREKEYAGKLVLTGSQLKVKGCVLGICRDGGIWSRVN